MDTNDKKRNIIEMAKQEMSKPDDATLASTDKFNPSYDPVFNEEIRRLAPHWFNK